MIKKILCIGPFKKPSNAYLRTVSFERLGYEVRRVDISEANNSKNIFLKIFRRLDKPFLRRRLLKQIGIDIKEFLPDLVFIEKGICFNRNDIDFFKSTLKKNTKIAHLNPDDPFGDLRKGWKKFVSSISSYDVHFVPKEANRKDYKERGAKEVFVYDRSFSPEYHRPIKISEKENTFFKSCIGFIGSYAPLREYFIYQLITQGIEVAIWGDGWEKGKYWNIIKLYFRAESQTGDNYIKVISGMDIALHFVRHENRDLQDSRTFEIPACGTFMLAERTSDHERLFIEDREVVFFDSIETCLEKCKIFLKNDEDRLKIAKAGYNKVINSNYDYKSRSKEMIEAIEGCEQNNKFWIGIR